MADESAVENLSIDQMSAQATIEPVVESKAPESKVDARVEPVKTEPKKAEPAKTEPKPVEPKKTEPAKKEDVVEEDHTKHPAYKNANAELRKILDKTAKDKNELKQRVDSLAPLESKVAEYEKRIKEIESKPVETKADTALVEKYENEIKALQSRIRESDYPRSDEFKEKFVTPLNKRYQKAISQVTQLTVTDNDQSRAATQADFDYIRGLPFGQQRVAARQLFGPDSDLILSHVNAISEIQEQAREAIENEKANGETRQKELTLKQQKEQTEYARILKQGEEEIMKEFDTFKFSDDPKEQELFDSAQSFVNEAMNNSAGLPVDKRASFAAALKMKAVGYDIERNRRIAAQEQVKSLTEELAKYRNSDPGAGGENPAVEPVEEENLGIEAMLNKAPEAWRK